MSLKPPDLIMDEEWEDPIVKEVHETRARILARFGGDFHAYVNYIKALEAEDKRLGVQYASPPPRRPSGYKHNAHATPAPLYDLDPTNPDAP